MTKLISLIMSWGTPSYSGDLQGCNILWNGYYFDDETDNYYLRNRHYSPLQGLFLTEDPRSIKPDSNWNNQFKPLLQYQDGLHLYEYAISNPVNNDDAYGLSSSRPEPEPTPPIPRRGWHDETILNVTSIECHGGGSVSGRYCPINGAIREVNGCSSCERLPTRYDSLGWRKREKIEERKCDVSHATYACECNRWKLKSHTPIGRAVNMTVFTKFTCQRYYGFRWPPSFRR